MYQFTTLSIWKENFAKRNQRFITVVKNGNTIWQRCILFFICFDPYDEQELSSMNNKMNVTLSKMKCPYMCRNYNARQSLSMNLEGLQFSIILPTSGVCGPLCFVTAYWIVARIRSKFGLENLWWFGESVEQRFGKNLKYVRCRPWWQHFFGFWTLSPLPCEIFVMERDFEASILLEGNMFPKLCEL